MQIKGISARGYDQEKMKLIQQQSHIRPKTTGIHYLQRLVNRKKIFLRLEIIFCNFSKQPPTKINTPVQSSDSVIKRSVSDIDLGNLSDEYLSDIEILQVSSRRKSCITVFTDYSTSNRVENSSTIVSIPKKITPRLYFLRFAIAKSLKIFKKKFLQENFFASSEYVLKNFLFTQYSCHLTLPSILPPKAQVM